MKRTIQTLSGKGVVGSPQIEEYLDRIGRPAQEYLVNQRDSYVIESPAMQEIPTATRPRIEYRVNQRDSYVIVAQLCPEFTARLVDRW